MRIGVLSDVHGNLEALEAVLAHAESQSPDLLLCLGDFVGYGPDPNRCVEILEPRLRSAVVGNHDQAAVGAREIGSFNLYAQEAMVWTRGVLSEGVRNYLGALPEYAELPEVEGLLLAHGSPRWAAAEYVVDSKIAKASFLARKFRVAFVGHTHQPAVFVEAKRRVGAHGLLPEVPLSLVPRHRYIVNVGSVGQPRDGDPRAAYLLFDTDGPSATLYRVSYDLEATQRKMEEAGLPIMLIERLSYGR